MDAFAFEPLSPAVPSTVEEAGAALDDEALEQLRAAVRAEAEDEAEAIRAQAREEGRREGLEAAAQALAQALAEVGEQAQRRAEALEREAVELALMLAEKVVCGAIAVQPERVLDVVRGALRRIAERERVTLLVNPEDVPLVRGATESLTGLGGIDRLEVVEERRVPRGGCVLRTPEGEIDARLGEQLERARELVEAELGR